MNREQIETLRIAVQRRSIQFLDSLPSPWNKRGWFIQGGMSSLRDKRWKWLEGKADKILLNSGYIKNEVKEVDGCVVYTKEPQVKEMTFSPLGDPRYN